MSQRFPDWQSAHGYAQVTANRTSRDVAIRRVKELGRDGYNVSFAAVNDSDYARAEIVRSVVCAKHGAIGCSAPSCGGRVSR